MKARRKSDGEIIEVKEWRGASDVIYSSPDMNRFYQAPDLDFTSDAEGEEILTVSRKRVQGIYAQCEKVQMDDSPNLPAEAVDAASNKMELLNSLFGSKCLPDESEPPILSKVEKIGKDCKAEPKFHIGQRVRHKPTRLVDVIDGISQSAPYTYRFRHMVRPLREQEIFESDLEPYTEPLSQNLTENCDNENVISSTKTWTNVCPSPLPSQDEPDRDLCDKLIQRGFKNHNRLHLASIIMAGLLASDKDKHPVKRALELADALISETKKGSEQC